MIDTAKTFLVGSLFAGMVASAMAAPIFQIDDLAGAPTLSVITNGQETQITDKNQGDFLISNLSIGDYLVDDHIVGERMQFNYGIPIGFGTVSIDGKDHEARRRPARVN